MTLMIHVECLRLIVVGLIKTIAGWVLSVFTKKQKKKQKSISMLSVLALVFMSFLSKFQVSFFQIILFYIYIFHAICL